MGTHWSLLQVCSYELNKYVIKMFTNYQCHIFVVLFKRNLNSIHHQC